MAKLKVYEHLNDFQNGSVKGYRESIQKHVDHIGRLQTEQRDLMERLAQLTCPFSVGDRVIDQHGNKAQVSRIAPDRSWGEYSSEYVIFTKKIKKGGGLYTNENKVWNNHNQLKLDPEPDALP